MDDGARSRGRRALIASLLGRRTAEKPLLVVVEDLHWADEGVRDALADATALTATTPLVMVVTSRSASGIDSVCPVQAGETMLQ